MIYKCPTSNRYTVGDPEATCHTEYTMWKFTSTLPSSRT